MYITRKVKQTNGKENVSIGINQIKGKENCVCTKEFRVYPSQGKAGHDIHDRRASSKVFRQRRE